MSVGPTRPRPTAGVILALALLAGLLVAGPAAAQGGGPSLSLPFACGEQVHLSTYAGHGLALDMWRARDHNTSRGMVVVAPADLVITRTTSDQLPESGWDPISITARIAGDPAHTMRFTHLMTGSLTPFGIPSPFTGELLVAKGTPIGRVGWSGNVDPKAEGTSHLHVVLYQHGREVTPSFDGQVLTPRPGGASSGTGYNYVSHNSCDRDPGPVTAQGGGWSDWSSIPGAGFGMAAATGGDGRMEAMHRGHDGLMFHAWQTSPGAGWTFQGWSGVPGAATDLAMATGGGGKLEAWHVGSDGRMFHRYQVAVGGGWSDWSELPGTGTDIAAASYANGRLEIVHVGGGGRVHNRWQHEPNGGWSDWAQLGDLGGARHLAMAANHDDRLQVFAAMEDGRLMTIAQQAPGGSWGAWEQLGDGVADVAVGRNADGRLELFAVRPGGEMVVRWQTSPGGGWSGWNGIPGFATSIAVARNADGRLELFHTGRDGLMFHKWQLWPNGTPPEGTTSGGGADGHGGFAEEVPVERRLLVDTCADDVGCPGVPLRSAPDPAARNVIDAPVPEGAALAIDCQARGSTTTGRAGTSAIWNRVDFSGQAGWIASTDAATPGWIGPACDLPEEADGLPVARLAGEDLAVAISQRGFPTGADRVYLARRDVLADAVAGGALTDGPILMVPGCGQPVPAVLSAEVARLDPTVVVALGGPAAVCEETLRGVAAGRSTARLSGPSRFETAVEVSRSAFPDGADVAHIARADVLIDAVTAGALADGPVLLVPACGEVPAAVAAELDRLDADSVVAIGGRQAVCDDTLAMAADGRARSRLAGDTRFDTSAAIAQASRATAADVVYVADGNATADVVLAGTLVDGPVVLVPDCGAPVPPAVQMAVEGLRPQVLIGLGDEASVCDRALHGAGLHAAAPGPCTAVDGLAVQPGVAVQLVVSSSRAIPVEVWTVADDCETSLAGVVAAGGSATLTVPAGRRVQVLAGDVGVDVQPGQLLAEVTAGTSAAFVQEVPITG